MKILPHRDPFLMVDEVFELKPNESLKGRKTISGTEWFFKGHFPNNPVLPGVLQIEMMAQLGAVGVLKEQPGHWIYLVKCDRVKFRKSIAPPATLTLHSEFRRRRKKSGQAFCWITEGEEKVCEGLLTYFLVKDEQK